MSEIAEIVETIQAAEHGPVAKAYMAGLRGEHSPCSDGILDPRDPVGTHMCNDAYQQGQRHRQMQYGDR